MNKKRLQNYLLSKGSLWQVMFFHFYLAQFGLHKIKCDTVRLNLEKLCGVMKDDEDIELAWDVADYVDFYEDTIDACVGILFFDRPISWQYDFIKCVSEHCQVPIIQTLNIDAITVAFCHALLDKDIDLGEICRKLDKHYMQLFVSVIHKTQMYKRNFVLALETYCGALDNAENMNFRKLLDAYIPRCGMDGIINAYRHAMTADVKLTSEERECQIFAYHSPFFFDDENLAKGKLPEGSLFNQVERRMSEDKEWFEKNRHLLDGSTGYYGDDDDDDDEDDDHEYESDNDNDAEFLGSEVEFNHFTFFMDQLERCVVDLRFGKEFYANVYIERFPEDELGNSLNDFIRYHNGCLYTVEMVDNLDELQVVRDLRLKLAAHKVRIARLIRLIQYCRTAKEMLYLRNRIENLRKGICMYYCVYVDTEKF